MKEKLKCENKENKYLLFSILLLNKTKNPLGSLYIHEWIYLQFSKNICVNVSIN